ncbi:DUF4296 domain-containing protein [Winogradskyella pulchriflava]|uniref:DUF4296 domain-containing protein n=1 Tax=Winogradskyella pulchriflava TaxID=1110688 RepID=A0ABV6Q4I4_9FLAO
MKKLGVLFILTLLVLACSNEYKPKKPKNLIPEKKMEMILYDLYTINAAKGVNRKLLETNGIIPEDYVLNKHKIDSTQFADSNAFYAYDTETYKNMVENVKAKLEKEKKKFEELEKVEGMAAKRRRDSISKIKQKRKDSIKQAIKNDTINKAPVFGL